MVLEGFLSMDLLAPWKGISCFCARSKGVRVRELVAGGRLE